jgi:hypothetical protein
MRGWKDYTFITGVISQALVWTSAVGPPTNPAAETDRPATYLHVAVDDDGVGSLFG